MISLAVFSLVFALMRRRGFDCATQDGTAGPGNATAAIEEGVELRGVPRARSFPQIVPPSLLTLCSAIAADAAVAPVRGPTAHNSLASSCRSACKAEAVVEA